MIRQSSSILESEKLTPLDSSAVAESVIKSIRMLSHGKKHYQQIDPAAPLLNSKDLNSIIQVQKVRVTEQQKQKSLVDSMIDSGPSMETTNNNYNNSSIYSSNTIEKPSILQKLDDDDFDSSDEEDNNNKSLKNTNKKLKETPLDYSNQEKEYQNYKVQQHQDDNEDFLNDEEDDEDNEALFKNFVAPSRSEGKKKKPTMSSTLPNELNALSTKKGITIKPGQAIRVNPVKKSAKKEKN
jgi:hypothetical protein